MPRRKKTEAELEAEMRARATDIVARMLFAKEYNIPIQDEIAAWEELNEQEQVRFHNIAVVVLPQIERQHEESSARWKTEHQNKQV